MMILQGRLTRDPELRTTQSGVSCCLFNLAWSEKYKENETKCFLLCKAWRGTAETLARMCRKGQEILVAGHMVTEDWGRDGQKDEKTYCIVDRMHFCGPKQPGERREDGQGGDSGEWVNVQEGIDDELPFA